MQSSPPNLYKKRIYSVSELTAEIKYILEEKFSMIWINGEISNLGRPASGHLYFSLKDSRSQISGVMFRGQNRKLTFDLEDGMQVTGFGRISVYEPRGTYQIILEHVEPKGVGALQVAFEQLKALLSREGLFDDSRKQRLPFLPKKIAVVTSPTGAVVHDIINIVSRRFSSVDLLVVPVKVQGAGAVEEIVDALERLGDRTDIDAVILARGGGSLEDLQAFNSEAVARAIAASPLPLISAVGHETDFTIADFVADVRAATPSEAAEIVVPDKSDLERRHKTLASRLSQSFISALSWYHEHLQHIVLRLHDPRKRIQDFRLRLDDDFDRLVRAITVSIDRKQRELQLWHHRLNGKNPGSTLSRAKIVHQQIHSMMLKNLGMMLESKRRELIRLTGQLEALSPTAILDRGYSITRRFPGKEVVTDPETLALGSDVEVLVSKGTLTCSIKGKTVYGKEDN